MKYNYPNIIITSLKMLPMKSFFLLLLALVLSTATYAQVGINTSDPVASSTLDVNGQFILGTTGTIHKGITSFTVDDLEVPYLLNGAAVTISVTIPVDAQPSTTNATVLVQRVRD